MAYVAAPAVPSDLQPSFQTLKLVVSRTNGSEHNAWPLAKLVLNATRFDQLHFHGSVLIVQAVSDKEELVSATCIANPDSPPQCHSVSLELDPRKFYVAGSRAGKLLIGSKHAEVGADGLRACLFYYRPGTQGPPSTCSVSQADQAPLIPGDGPQAYFSVSPDGRYAAVLSRSQRSPSDPTAASVWVVIPTSEL